MLLLQFINVCTAANVQRSAVRSHLLLLIGAAVVKIFNIKSNSKRIICLLERLDGSYISFDVYKSAVFHIYIPARIF